jgi:cell division protein FtsI (penicillin-binding protein 3)
MRSKVRKPSKSWRLWLVGSVIGSCALIICTRLVWLHVFENQHLQGIGDELTNRHQDIPAYRGMITDRFGEPLAVSTPVFRIGVRPAELIGTPWAKKLAPFLDRSPEQLEQRVAQSLLPYLFLSRNVTPEGSAKIEALKLEGVKVEQQFRRFYPAGEVASHLLGFTDIDDEAQEGLELSFDHWLSGQDGSRHVLANRRANVVRYISAGEEVEHGKDLRLSIDLRLQYLTYRALKGAVNRSKAVGGSAVLVDAWSGEILALAAQPAFNPNNISSRTPDRVRNRTVSDMHEPGSSIKPFTIATAIDLGLIQSDTQIETTPGQFRVQGNVISDFKNYGLIDVSRVLSKSSNVGVAKIGLMMEPSALRDRLALLGFGQSTGIGFPGEAEGSLPSFAAWGDMDRAALSFGYGLNATTIQLAQAYSVFANAGVLKRLTLLSGGATPKPLAVFKAGTIEQVLPMLEAVTQVGGTATQAQVPMYRVGGKTGTTQKLSAGGSYASRQYVASFVGIAPLSNPRFVMAISVDDPRSQRYFGGQVAAPVFADVMDDVMRIYDIEPDSPKTRILAGRIAQ